MPASSHRVQQVQCSQHQLFAAQVKTTKQTKKSLFSIFGSDFVISINPSVKKRTSKQENENPD